MMMGNATLKGMGAKNGRWDGDGGSEDEEGDRK
jgi:hypothetical protein